MFDQVAERRRVGLKLLLLLNHHWQDITKTLGVDVTVIAPDIGVDRMTAVEIALKFHSQGLLNKTHDDIATISNRGLQEIEYAVSHPNDETQNFPPVNTIKEWIKTTFEAPRGGVSGDDLSVAQGCASTDADLASDIETHTSAGAPSENAQHAGAMIREFMDAEGYTIQEFAIDLKTSRQALSSAINGGNRHGKKLLIKLANRMDIEPDKLTGTDAANFTRTSRPTSRVK